MSGSSIEHPQWMPLGKHINYFVISPTQCPDVQTRVPANMNLSWLIVCLWTVLTNFKAEFALSTPALVTGIKSISDRIVLIHWKYYPFRITADCSSAYVRALHLRHHGHDGQTSSKLWGGGGGFWFWITDFLWISFHSGGCTPAPLFLYAGAFNPPISFFFFFPPWAIGGVYAGSTPPWIRVCITRHLMAIFAVLMNVEID